MSDKPYLSIVIPLFNEEEVFPKLLEELYRVCNSLNKSYEIIFVDDGSTDKTPHLLREASQKDSRIRALRFSRNFGHQAAFSAGIDFSMGEVMMTMDGDLQHPPWLIPAFLQEAENGNDIVIGERLSNVQNSRVREMAGKTFYKMMTAMTNLEFKNVSDFALYKRPVIDVLKRLPERERYLRGMIQWLGFKKKYLPYAVEARKAGTPKYTIKRLTGLVLSGVTSFSAFPLRFAFWAGLFVFIASIIFSGYVVIDHYVNPNPLIAGWATLVIIVLFIGSIQLMVLGVVGEYLYKMFNEIKGRPLYIVSEAHNIQKERLEGTAYGLHAL